MRDVPGAPSSRRGGATDVGGQQPAPDGAGHQDLREDLRLLPVALGAWLAAGAAVALPAAAAGVAGGALLLLSLGLLAAVVRRRRPGATAATTAGRCTSVAAVVAAAGVVCCAAAVQLGGREGGLLPDLVARSAVSTLEARVASDPHPVPPVPGRASGPRWTARLDVLAVTGRGVRSPARARVLAVGGGAVGGLRRAERVVLVGRLVGTEPGDDLLALLRVQGPVRSTSAPTGWRAVAEHLRAGLRTASTGLPPDARGLLPGLVAGDTSALPPDLEDAMRTTGLTHLTAVSGGNIAVLTGAVLLLGGHLGLRRRLRTAAAAGALAGFVVLVGPDPSVLRAGVMAAVALVGVVAARPGRGVPALATGVLVLLVADPWWSRSYGFALSVLATGGLLLLARPWGAGLGHVLPARAAQALAVPLAAQVACAPVLVLLAPQVSLVAVPANLLAAPAVVPATLLGLLALCCAPWWAAAAACFAHVAGWSSSWVALVARTGARVPGAALPWPQGWRGAALLAGALLAGVVLVPLLVRAAAGVTRTWLAAGGRPAPDRRRLVGVVLAVVLVLLAASLAPRARARLLPAGAWPPPGWQVVQCDVGQGDAMVVRSGAGSAVVVDTGPDPGLVAGCLDRLAVRRVDLLVLTHFHADHVDGLPGVLEGRTVTRALVSPLAVPADGARTALATLAAAGVPVQTGEQGMSGRAGDVTWEALWPLPGAYPEGTTAAGSGEDDGANDASVVVALVAGGVRVGALGDLGQQAQAELLRSSDTGGVPWPPWPVDVLKVAHHGSADTEPRLVDRAAPRVAVVGVGENDYGHPTASALDMLAAEGALTACTLPAGDIAVSRVDGMRVEQAGGLVVTASHGDPPGC